MESPQAAKWKKATDKEMTSLDTHEVWEVLLLDVQTAFLNARVQEEV